MPESNQSSAVEKTTRRHSRARPLRHWIFGAAGISIAGAFIAAGLTTFYIWRQQELRLGLSLVATTRALIQSTEQELDQAAALARFLSLSAHLRAGDLAAFENQGRELVEPFGYSLVLNRVGAPNALAVSSLTRGPILRVLPLNWTEPVRDGTVRLRPLVRLGAEWVTAVQRAVVVGAEEYIVTIILPASGFQAIINKQQLPPEWLPIILDEEWTIVARGHGPEQFVGRTGANPEVRDLPAADVTYEGEAPEGYTSLHARSRSERYGWTASIAVPQPHLLREFFDPAALAGFTVLAVSLIAFAALWLLARRLVQDVRVLSDATRLLPARPSSSMDLHVEELEDVARNIEDTSRRLETEEKFRKRVVDELAHRLRNKVATVQAIVRLQLRQHPELRDEVAGRLDALSATDELISAAQGQGANLRDVVDAELRPYGAFRFTAEGQDVFLEPNLALVMALLVHELATNAAKYGSLSLEEGSVSVRWSMEGDVLSIEWRESGGPPVAEPERQGFGTKLLTAALASMDGDVVTDFAPDGLVVRMTVRMPSGGG